MAEEDDDAAILYDLLVPAEWTVQPEPLTNVILDTQQTWFARKLLSAAIRTGWTVVRSIGIPLTTATRCSLPASLIKLVNSQMSWHLALNVDGKLLAVLQDSCIEIRTFRDEFATVIGKCQVPRDFHPQWRQLAWSPDSSMILCSDSYGNVRVFDMMGHHLYTIERTEQASSIDTSVDFSCAIAGLVFTGYKQTTQWSAELLVINYHGALRCYLLSPSGYHESHTFLFSSHYPQGISCAVYDTQHSLLLIGGLSEKDTDQAESVVVATYQGLTAWRDLSVAPYYKLVTDYDREYGQGGRRGLLKRISRISTVSNYFLQSPQQDGIFKMCLSPKGTVLATIHQSGLLGLWDVPSMRRKKAWPKEQQPGLDEAASTMIIPTRKRKLPEGQISDMLADVNFWSESSMVLARFSGALTVCSSSNLENRLGDSTEQLDSAPRLTPRFGKGFLALECDTKAVAPGHRNFSTSESIDSDGMNSALTAESDDEDEDGEEDVSYLSRSTGYVRQALYFITDSDRFQPPRKKTKVMKHTYRLVGLQETTPQELYSRRIKNEEYGEALAIAKRFQLDTDLVYQTQWKKHPVSLATIQDYLSKITKRSWVLHECLERVPEDIDAARELLEYGLTGTDVKALIVIGEGTDEGRFIDCTIDDMDDTLDGVEDSVHNFNEDEATVAARKRREQRQELIKEVDFGSLNIEQKELITARLRILSYLDRLKTYEDIKGGQEMAARLYSEEDFHQFRSRNIVELAVENARGSNWREVETLLSYHGKELLPYWLMILNEFPETTPPKEYKQLLPGLSTGSDEVWEWGQQSLREPDWSEDPQIFDIVHHGEQDPGQEFFDENDLLGRFSAEVLTKEMLIDWYSYRVREVESQSHQMTDPASRLPLEQLLLLQQTNPNVASHARWHRVDNALGLARLAKDQGIKELSDLEDNLHTLEVMIYEAEVDPNLTLEELEKKSDLDKIKLFMAKTPKKVYVKNIKRWVLPFLERGEVKTPGIRGELLHDYILSTAEEDLEYCLQIFENCKLGVPNPILIDMEEIVSLALECVYRCKEEGQHGNAQKILGCLPKKGFGVIAEDMSALYHEIEQLEHHLRALDILMRRGIHKTMRFIRDTQTDPEKAEQLIMQLTRHASKPDVVFKNLDWYHLLEDCMELRDKVYSCMDRKRCLAIFVESLLGSERQSYIHLAGEFLAKTKLESTKVIKRPKEEAVRGVQPTTESTLFKLRLNKVPYASSVRLVLSAAKEYFDASTKLVDHNMELARSCLQLISEPCPEIDEELDLIQSLSLLEEFKTPVLPLKVRLSENRLDLVSMALQSKPTAYRSSGKILDLARLLRVYKSDETKEKGSVHVLIAETALKAADYNVAHQQCEAIIRGKHSEGWAVCKRLAEEREFKDKTARQELIAFALCYCDPSSFGEILALRTSNELQMLGEILGLKPEAEKHEDEGEKMEVGEEGDLGDEETDEDESFYDTHDTTPAATPEKGMFQAALGRTTATTRNLLSSTGATTRHVLASTGATTRHMLASTGATTRNVLASTGATTKALLGTMGDAAFWKESLKWVRPLSHRAEEEAPAVEDLRVDVQWCHPFYEGVFGNSQNSKEYPDFSQIHHSVSQSSPAYLNEALLRFSMLARGQQEGASGVGEEHTDQQITEVLLQLATQRLTSELSLTICYLLALMKPLAAEDFFAKMPRSEVTLQMAAYVYALQVSAWSERNNQSSLANLHRMSPSTLIEKVKKHVTSKKVSDWSEDLRTLADRFKTYVNLLDDFVQGQTLQNLGRGVDVARFTSDDEYKKETILGLTMSLEDDVYDLSVGLAKKYDLSLWEVYMSHVEFLFSDSGLKTSEIEERIKKLDILPTLLSQPADFSTRLQQEIYPLIEGSDYPSLIYYYTLLEGQEIEGGVHAPTVHIKNLRKISRIPGLDYKQLMDGQSNPAETLTPVLDSSTVEVLAKIAGKIPGKDDSFLTSSQVYSIFLSKYFWQGDQDSKKRPDSTAKWLHRYEACGEYFSKTTPTDHADFVKAILFSKESLKMLDLDCRQNIVGRALKYARPKGGSKQKLVKESQSTGDASSAFARFQQYQKHLQSLTNDSVLEFENIDQQNGTQYYRDYDLTCGDEIHLKTFVGNLICEGVRLDLMQAIIRVCSISNWSCASAVKEQIAQIADQIRNHQEGLNQTLAPVDVLTKVVDSVRAHTEEGGTFVNHNHVLSILKPFCDDVSVPAEARVEILQLMEETFDLSSDDSLDLLLSQTRALVSTSWKREVASADIGEAPSRLTLFKELLSSADTFDQLVTLSKLLRQWPSFQSDENSDSGSQPWVLLLEAMTQEPEFKGQTDVFLEIVGTEQCNSNLTRKNVDGLYQKLKSLAEPLAGWKVILLCRKESLFDQLRADWGAVTEVTSSVSDDQLLDLIISNDLSSSVIETVFYPPLVDHLLSMEDRAQQATTVEKVADQLNSAGFKAEGASLLLRFRGTQPMFYTLDTAFSVVSKWFQKR